MSVIIQILLKWKQTGDQIPAKTATLTRLYRTSHLEMEPEEAERNRRICSKYQLRMDRQPQPP